MSSDPSRFLALKFAKLAALVGAHLGEKVSPDAGVGLSSGAALVVGTQAWVLNDQDSTRVLGPALAWAGRQHEVNELHLIVESQAPHLVRQAKAFVSVPHIWKLEGTELVAASTGSFEEVSPLDPALAAYAGLFTNAGARAVVENDMLVAEVAGLEVARVFLFEGVPTIEIGVGRFDKEAHQLINAQRSHAETLEEVVALVRRYRHPGAAPHPLNRIARERFARSLLIDSPELVGASHLEPMQDLRCAPDLRTPWPSVAIGTDVQGNPLVVVCSVGVDLDLIPMAAEARMADGRNAQLVIALPERDLHPVTTMMAGFLTEPVEFVTIDLLT
ncbi:MAG: hypothetical protein ACSLFB_00820 [Acidimicrobiales bacterium]